MASVESGGEAQGADDVETGSEEREVCSQSHSALSLESRTRSQPEAEEEVGCKKTPEARECASDHFYDRITTMIPDEDLQKILRYQKHALTKFEKTNETFGKFNELSEARYEELHMQFKNNTRMLVDMKKDLDSIFRRIRMLKVRLGKQYEEAFAAREHSVCLDDEEKQDEV